MRKFLDALFWLFFVLIFVFGGLGIWVMGLKEDEILQNAFLLDFIRFMHAVPLVSMLDILEGLEMAAFYSFVVPFWLCMLGANFCFNYIEPPYHKEKDPAKIVLSFVIISGLCVAMLGGFVVESGLSGGVRARTSVGQDIYMCAYVLAWSIGFIVVGRLASVIVHMVKEKK